MDLNRDFEKDVNWVLEMCEQRVQTYPASLKNEGLDYLKKLSLLQSDSKRKGGFCYHIPFWLEDIFEINREICRTIALGNTFKLLYFMSQDELYDYTGKEVKAHVLPLSNLFYLDFLEQYRSIFASSSPFWIYFNKYIHEWSHSILWERRHHWGKATPYSEEDMILLSRKAAPLKLTFTAMCILSGHQELIEVFESMMDYDQVTYQMVDDWRDWQSDLNDGNYTYFLNQVMDYCHISDCAQLNESHITKAVFVGEILGKMFNDIALKYNQMAKECIKGLHAPYLHQYLDTEKQVCMRLIAKVQRERQRMMQSGLNELLHQLVANKKYN